MRFWRPVVTPSWLTRVWLLTQIPLAARAPDFGEAAWKLGLNLGSAPSLLEVVAAFSDAVDRAASGSSGRTDLGEMARLAAAESLAAAVGRDLPRLFGESPDDVRLRSGSWPLPTGSRGWPGTSSPG